MKRSLLQRIRLTYHLFFGISSVKEVKKLYGLNKLLSAFKDAKVLGN